MGVCRTTVTTVGTTNNVSPNNNKRNKQPSRGRSRQTPVIKSQVVSMMAPRRVFCPSEPPAVQNNVRVTKSIQLDLSVTNSAKDIRVVDLMASVPGGTTFWSHVRFQSFRIWAETEVSTTSGKNGDTPVLRVDAQNVGVNQPTVSWTDTGTTGQRRPGIAFEPSLGLQLEWLGVASTQTLFNVRVTNAPATVFTGVTIQCVCELLSPNLSG